MSSLKIVHIQRILKFREVTKRRNRLFAPLTTLLREVSLKKLRTFAKLRTTELVDDDFFFRNYRNLEEESNLWRNDCLQVVKNKKGERYLYV